MSRPASPSVLISIVLVLGATSSRSASASTILVGDFVASHRVGSPSRPNVLAGLPLGDRLALDMSGTVFAEPFSADPAPGRARATAGHPPNLRQEITDQLASVPETATVCLLGLGLLAIARGLRRKLARRYREGEQP